MAFDVGISLPDSRRVPVVAATVAAFAPAS